MTSELPDDSSVEYDSVTDTYRATFDCAETPPSMAVVEVLADITETDPLELPPLHDVVDPATLDQLCTGYKRGRQEGDGKASFTYLDYAVTVKSYGIVEVRPRSPDG